MLESLRDLPPYTPELGEKLSKGLRERGVGADLVAAALTQLQLRAQAREKFGDFAARLLFTREGLEQATRLPVAARHAQRFRAAGCSHLADLGCGLGTESLAAAGLGLRVSAFEIDEGTAALALMNLRDFPEASVTCADITALDWETLRAQGVDGAFCDPARRGPGGRKLRPEDWSPSLSTALSWAEQVPRQNLGLKVAPGIEYRYLPAGAQVEWVSLDGDLLEAAIWLGDLRQATTDALGQELEAGQGGRLATVLRHDAAGKLRAWQVAVPGEATQDPAPAPPVRDFAAHLAAGGFPGQGPGIFLYEADPAVIRAGALAALAEKLGLAVASPQIAYLLGGAIEPDWHPFFQAYQVLEAGPLKERQISQALGRWEAGSLEIKKRGVEVSPEQLRRKLRGALRGTQELTLILTRLEGRHSYLLARRV